jgi:hypothetical protein
MSLINDILEEWAYRVDNGMPNPKNSKHITELSLILSEMGLGGIKHQLIKNLMEADGETFTATKKDTEETSVFKSKEARDAAVKAGTHIIKADDKEEPKKVAGSDLFGGDYQAQRGGGEQTPQSKEEPKTTTPERKKLNQTQETIRQSLNDGDFSEIVKSSDEVNTLRDTGIAGAGGPVASYGEARLTSTANEFNGDGYSNWKDDNKQAIDSEKENITKNLSKYKNKIKEVSKQLGVSDEEATEYLAQRKVFGDLELKRLENNPDSLWHKSGKQGFNKDPEALRKWTDAQFDGAHATLYEVQNGSNIDSTKPFHVIQSNPKAGEADDAVKEHLYDQLEKAKESGNKDDITHYEREIRAFEKLGFHDTMVIGKDANDRTTILHITNKKQNDLVDIWGNTTPEYMLNVIKKSFGPDVSEAVIKAADDGIEKCKDGKQATNRAFQSMEFDDDFIKITETKEMSKYMNVLREHKAFNKFAQENGMDLQKVSNKELLSAVQKYMKSEQEKGKEVSYTTFGKVLTKVGELAQVGPFVRKNPQINFESDTVKSAIKNKNDEKDLVAAVHNDIVNNIREADSGFPDKDGNNGKHTQAYIATVMHSMHFDLMVENFDNNLSAVTGIRGSRPGDFRGCLAQLSGFDGDVDSNEGRDALNEHLLKKCRINATTGYIEITNESGTVSLAEDSWRTSGESKKVEKKLGKGLRECVAGKVDSRKANK